jgi:hypothetical protein
MVGYCGWMKTLSDSSSLQRQHILPIFRSQTTAMKILLIIIAFIAGGFMLLDGIYVMLNGKYIGPDKPGPWANLFYKLNVNVFKLGPLFVTYGLVWLIFLYGVITSQAWAYKLGLIISLLTLWYLPVGTLLSLIVLAVLLLARQKAGL